MVCGYGRFGAEVVQGVSRPDLDVTIIDPTNPASTTCGVVRGFGTDAATLDLRRRP